MVQQISTTAGPRSIEQLGRTMGHEHLRSINEAVHQQFPHLYDDAALYRVAVEKISRLKDFGVDTVVDPTILDLGRDVTWNLRATEETGLAFVMGTGVYGAGTSCLPVYFHNRDVNALRDAFIHDITEGIQGTEVRAEFIKCACDTPGMTEDIEKIHRATARAALATGVPVMVHSHPGERTGLESLRVLNEEGLDSSRVQIAHMGDSEDLAFQEELLQAGCYLGFDRYGLEDYLPTEKRNAVLCELVRGGWGHRIIAGQDYNAVLDWFDPDALKERWPEWSFTFIFEKVFPALADMGLTQTELDALVGSNVHAWLTSGQKAGV